MIDARELRLGNLINNEQRTEVIRFVDKWRVQCYLINDKEENVTYVPINLIKPILLTEEWLIKFGFKVWGGANVFADKDNFWVMEKGEEEECFYCDHLELNIKHVHQLQNLYFSLTNKELTIKK